MSVEAKPAATLILIKESAPLAAKNFELFMVQRNHQIDFASGALVFPGGKIDDTDKTLAHSESGIVVNDLAKEPLIFAIAAIRETFEESGILFAVNKNNLKPISIGHLRDLQKYRAALVRGEYSFSNLLNDENLLLDVNALSLFTRWITPEQMPKRFDTYFFIARAPEGQLGLHDGYESIDSLWITPTKALAEADSGKYKIIFPTLMNLRRLSEYNNFDDTIRVLKTTTVKTIIPWTETINGEIFLKIPENAGYNITAIPLTEVMRN